MKAMADDALGEYQQTLALRAFERASTRLVAERHDEERAYGAAGEALFWAIVCDEGYESLLDRTKYRRARNADSDGRVMLGIRWARNRMTHQRALVIRKHYGAELDSMILDKAVLDTRDHMLWASAESVPQGSDDFGRDVYVERLQGKPVEESIKACRRWLYGPSLADLNGRDWRDVLRRSED